MSVSVVIPTVGRSTLVRAVASVLGQTVDDCEVVVVNDGAKQIDQPFAGNSRVRLVSTLGGQGGNTARMLGVESAGGDKIAFLDDDDYWLPGKIDRQLNVMASTNADIVACQTLILSSQAVRLWPRVEPTPNDMSSYLLRRGAVRSGGSFIPTSSLLVKRSLLEAIPLRTDLKIHQDLDWLLRTCGANQGSFAMVDEPLLVYNASGSSVSLSARWEDSLGWVQEMSADDPRKEYSDFLLTSTFSMAARRRDLEGMGRVIMRALQLGAPSWKAVLYVLGTSAGVVRDAGRSA